jgi:sugar phosphate isomerase/epimerase
MQRVGARYVRIMSFKPADDADKTPPEVFERVNEVVGMFLDAGIQPLHENCMNCGGMSWRHALELLEKCPRLQWVFDTANPVFNPDRSKPQPWPRQEPWEFWTHVRDRVAHIHIKDAVWNPAKRDADYTWPGEGDGRVHDILKDAIARGYDAGISIEPHMVAVFHNPKMQSTDAAAMHTNFVEYGRRLERLVGDIRAGIPQRHPAKSAA